MFAGICVGGWDSGVGEVVVFSMGTRLLTAAKEEKKKSYKRTNRLGISRHSLPMGVNKNPKSSALTGHDVVQRVCERLCRCSDHEPIWGLLRYHTWA